MRFVEARSKTNEELSFYDQVELVKSFCHLWDRLNASNGSDAAETANTWTEWINSENVKNCFTEKASHRKANLFELRKVGDAVLERDIVVS